MKDWNGVQTIKNMWYDRALPPTLEHIYGFGQQLEGGKAGGLQVVQGVGVTGHGLPRVQEYGLQEVPGRDERSLRTKSWGREGEGVG